MKKLFKFIPLLVIPMMLTSCMDMFFRPADNTESGSHSQTSEPSSGSGSSSGSHTSSSSESGGGNSGSSSSSESTTIYPTSLAISGATSLYVGEETTLTATYQPTNITYKTINWYTSDSSVASITSTGKVKGKAGGQVTITAKLKSADGYMEATHDMTIVVPSVSGVSITKRQITLGFNQTYQLEAVVLPVYANQAVTWSSSSPSVATVDQNGLVTAKNVEGTANIKATTVEGDFDAFCTVTVQAVTGTTVMIYMCGADLESAVPDRGSGYLNSGYQGLASMDIDEILSVTGQPSNVNIVLETGGAKHWAKSQINPDYLERWEIRDQTLTRKAQLAKDNMGDGNVLKDFINWSVQNYPAQKYGLIMWNHGGAMGGCCFDENFDDDSISEFELYTAVSEARTDQGISEKFEWITYDACLMAVQDVAEYNSYNFNYMLSSQESESGYGYDYDAWLPILYSNPAIEGDALLQVIAHTFMLEEKQLYQSWYGSRWAQYFDQTQAVYDLSKVRPYRDAFETFANSVNGIIGNTDSKAKTLGGLINNAKKYGEDEDEYGDTIYPFDIFDAKEVLTKITANSAYSSLSTQANNIKTLIDDLVVYEEHGEGTTGCGLCIFCPMSGYSYPYEYTYQGVLYGPKTNFSNWKTVANKVFWACYE